MEYRVENKYLVSDLDIAVLSQRLKVVMQNDIHQDGDSYNIRSVYFDDICDSCMLDNDAGIDCRKKYRIRTYDVNDSLVKLEIKEKLKGLTRKHSCTLSREECQTLLENPSVFQLGKRKELNQLLLQVKCVQMQPKSIIEYERTAFVHPVGNVRVTFDRNIMASKFHNDFFEDRIVGKVPILPKGWHILEVKYDEFLPDIIAKQLEIGKLRKMSFSKYYLGRLALNGEFVEC